MDFMYMEVLSVVSKVRIQLFKSDERRGGKAEFRFREAVLEESEFGQS